MLPPTLALILLGVWLGQRYIKAKMPVKRLLSNSRSPVVGVLRGVLEGIGELSFSISFIQCSVLIELVE